GQRDTGGAQVVPDGPFGDLVDVELGVTARRVTEDPPGGAELLVLLQRLSYGLAQAHQEIPHDATSPSRASIRSQIRSASCMVRMSGGRILSTLPNPYREVRMMRPYRIASLASRLVNATASEPSGLTSSKPIIRPTPRT